LAGTAPNSEANIDFNTSWSKVGVSELYLKHSRLVAYALLILGMAWCCRQFEDSRLRRAEIGTHHHIAGPYLASYAAEMDWREDRRRVSNGGNT
jgi:hypothetical protein